jgi:hypothetical protein
MASAAHLAREIGLSLKRESCHVRMDSRFDFMRVLVSQMGQQDWPSTVVSNLPGQQRLTQRCWGSFSKI